MIYKLFTKLKTNAVFRHLFILALTLCILLAGDLLLFIADRLFGVERGVIFSYNLSTLIIRSNLAIGGFVVFLVIFSLIIRWLNLEFLRRLVKNLLMSVVSVTITLFIVEVIFYFALKHKAGQSPGQGSYPLELCEHNFFRSDPILGYAANKNVRSRYRKVEITPATKDTTNIFDFIVHTDSLGNRLIDIPGMKDRPKYALFFGCSFTFGLGVADTLNPPYLFAKNDTSYCSYNYAFTGYGPQSMLAQLQNLNIRKQIKQDSGSCFYVYMNAHPYRVIGDMRTYVTYGHDLPYYDYRDGKVHRYGLFKDNRPFLSTFYSLMSKSNFVEYFKINFPSKLSPDHYKLTCDIIYQSFLEYKKQFHNDNFYVVVYPYCEDIVPYLKDYNLRVLDLSKLFNNLNKDLCYIPKDGHPTAYANKVFTRELVNRMNSRPGGEEMQLAKDGL